MALVEKIADKNGIHECIDRANMITNNVDSKGKLADWERRLSKTRWGRSVGIYSLDTDQRCVKEAERTSVEYNRERSEENYSEKWSEEEVTGILSGLRERVSCSATRSGDRWGASGSRKVA